MRRGTVREWDGTHGFIEWPGGAVFVYWTDVEMRSRRNFHAGDEVEFEIEECAHGFHAVRVKVLKSAV